MTTQTRVGLPCNGNWWDCMAGEAEGGIWVHLRFRFRDVFVPNELIEKATRTGNRRRERNRVYNRTHTAGNIALGLVCGSYQEE